MRNPSEAFFKALHKHLETLESPPESEEGIDQIVQDFMKEYNERLTQRGPLTEKTAQTSDDFLELAEKAPSKTKKLKYVKKACELDEKNLDAGMELAMLTSRSTQEFFQRIEELLARGKKQMEEDGFFAEENIGNFWKITDTRPFMRVYEAYMDILMNDGKLHQAIAAGQEMLRLCKDDNLGIRYVLMNCYAELEDKAGAEALHQRYEKEESTMHYLPLAYICYRLGEEDKAAEYLKLLMEVNRDTERSFMMVLSDIRPDSRMSPYGYRPGTIEEFMECLDLGPETYKASFSFWSWGLKKIKEMEKEAKEAKKAAKALAKKKKK